MRYEEYDPQELEDYIARMQTIAARLRVLGMNILVATIINLASAFAVAIDAFPGFIALRLSAVLLVMIILLAMLFEQLGKRGEIIYEEVTDELHRFHKETGMDNSRIAFRIALKNFATSTDLPLMPGRYGVSLYIFLNFFVIMFQFLHYRAF